MKRKQKTFMSCLGNKAPRLVLGVVHIVVVDNKAKYVYERRIKVKPIIRYYGDAPYMDMKATCPICEAVNVRADLAGGAGNDFNQCPVCGISLDWTDYLKEFKELRGKIEEALKKEG